jgi:hypothetical protein
MTFSGSFLMFLEAQTCWASKYFFKNWLGVWCYPPVLVFDVFRSPNLLGF